MIPFEVIDTVASRESMYPGRHVFLPRLTQAPFDTPEHDAWVRQNWWMVDYDVLYSDKERARSLAAELSGLFADDPKSERIAPLVEEIRKLRNKPDMRSSLQSWQWMAYQLPDDIGGGRLTKQQITMYLSERYKGRVLEAMCGFNSYFLDDQARTVVALDYCREALERYPYPKRTRILVDLNQATDDCHLECFDEPFDAISICFGFRYPDRPTDVFRELRRHLKDGGVLSLIENPDHGYENLCKRGFSPKTCGQHLRAAGFQGVRVCEVPIERKGFYHVEAH